MFIGNAIGYSKSTAVETKKIKYQLLTLQQILVQQSYGIQKMGNKVSFLNDV